MYSSRVKRLMDISASSILLILSAPVTLVIIVLIKLESKGPAIFTQERTGLGGKPFKMGKFRSMTYDNNVHDSSSADRYTRVGKVLRATSLDEIPQLVNVLKGDMSFIGPRPWITEYHKHMNKHQRRRHDVRPGITGLAQAKGRNGLTIEEKIAYDLEYVKGGVGLRDDIKIVVLTVKSLFDASTNTIGKHGIHSELEHLRQKNSAVMDEVEVA